MHKDQDGWELVYACGGCAEYGFIEAALAFEAHRLCSKKLIYMGRNNITPAKLPKQMVEFKSKRLGKLKLHSAQLLRIMLLSGHFVLGPEMVNNGVCSGILWSWFASMLKVNWASCELEVPFSLGVLTRDEGSM
jgi:hypothetical protein